MLSSSLVPVSLPQLVRITKAMRKAAKKLIGFKLPAKTFTSRSPLILTNKFIGHLACFLVKQNDKPGDTDPRLGFRAREGYNTFNLVDASRIFFSIGQRQYSNLTSFM